MAATRPSEPPSPFLSRGHSEQPDSSVPDQIGPPHPIRRRKRPAHSTRSTASRMCGAAQKIQPMFNRVPVSSGVLALLRSIQSLLTLSSR